MSVVVKIIALNWYRIPIKVSGIFLKTNVNILLLSSVLLQTTGQFYYMFSLSLWLKIFNSSLWTSHLVQAANYTAAWDTLFCVEPCKSKYIF